MSDRLYVDDTVLDDFGGGVTGIVTISIIIGSSSMLDMIAWSNLGETIKN